MATAGWSNLPDHLHHEIVQKYSTLVTEKKNLARLRTVSKGIREAVQRVDPTLPGTSYAKGTGRYQQRYNQLPGVLPMHHKEDFREAKSKLRINKLIAFVQSWNSHDFDNYQVSQKAQKSGLTAYEVHTRTGLYQSILHRLASHSLAPPQSSTKQMQQYHKDYTKLYKIFQRKSTLQPTKKEESDLGNALMDMVVDVLYTKRRT